MVSKPAVHLTQLNTAKLHSLATQYLLFDGHTREKGLLLDGKSHSIDKIGSNRNLYPVEINIVVSFVARSRALI